MQNKLPLHEWIAVLILIAILFILTGLSIWSNRQSFPKVAASEHRLVDDTIEVIVEGYVEIPNRYIVKKGSLVRDVIALANPLPEADLSKIKMGKKVREGDIFDVPRAKMITVHLQGAVEIEGPYSVRKGANLEELIAIVKFKEDANLKKLKKKRKLKDGERINISFL